MNNKLIVSANPHIKTKESITRIMHTVNISLIPAIFASYWFFGIRSIILILVSVITAIATEAAIQKFRNKKVTVADGSAILTGILLAFNVPPFIPWWIVMIGSFFSIAIAKQAFGGLGFNIFNPALIGRAFMLASWPVQMTSNTYWAKPLSGLGLKWANLKTMDAVSSATPLNLVKSALKTDPKLETLDILAKDGVSYLDLFLGNVSGCIGETSFLALLIGGLYLIYKGYVNWRVPVFYMGTVFLLALVTPGVDATFYLLSGGLALGAFYMATDMVTSPISNKGNIVFGIGLGLFTIAIRFWGGYPEGVSYSILLMNIAVPLIDRYLIPKKFGFRKKEK